MSEDRTAMLTAPQTTTRRRWRILIVTLIFSNLIAAGLLAMLPNCYLGRVTIDVHRELSINANSNEPWWQTELRIFSTPAVCQQVAEKLKLAEKWQTSPQQAQKRIADRLDLQADNIAGTEDRKLLRAMITSPDPAEATELANSLAEIYIRRRIDLAHEMNQAREKFLSDSLDEQRAIVRAKRVVLRDLMVGTKYQGENALNPFRLLQADKTAEELMALKAGKIDQQLAHPPESLEAIRKDVSEIEDAAIQKLETQLKKARQALGDPEEESPGTTDILTSQHPGLSQARRDYIQQFELLEQMNSHVLKQKISWLDWDVPTIIESSPPVAELKSPRPLPCFSLGTLLGMLVGIPLAFAKTTAKIMA